MKFKKIIFAILIATLAWTAVYYFYPVKKIPESVTIDKLVVLKSKRRLLAYSHGQLIVTYKISIGKNPTGDKEIQNDNKTPEGLYIINDKNSNSDFHKNLGISYPNQQDIQQARQLGKPTGGDIKIHGLKNGKGYIGRFHRWNDWTNGCIALTDEEVDEIYNHTPVGTPIEIRK
jgi:murein L,D-transpeptidase YafK